MIKMRIRIHALASAGGYFSQSKDNKIARAAFHERWVKICAKINSNPKSRASESNLKAATVRMWIWNLLKTLQQESDQLICKENLQAPNACIHWSLNNVDGLEIRIDSMRSYRETQNDDS